MLKQLLVSRYAKGMSVKPVRIGTGEPFPKEAMSSLITIGRRGAEPWKGLLQLKLVARRKGTTFMG